MLPMEWMTDVDYLRFRLSNPSEIEIYKRTFDYYTQNLSEQIIKDFYQSSGSGYRLGMPLYFTNGNAAHQSALLYCVKGFCIPETTHVWSDGEESEMVFELLDEVNGDLKLHFKIMGAYLTQTVQCLVNNIDMGSVSVNVDSISMLFYIPAVLINHAKLITVKLKYSNPETPVGDNRLLAVSFEQMSIVCVDQMDKQEKRIEELESELESLNLQNTN
jgi:hypothetical protein